MDPYIELVTNLVTSYNRETHVMMVDGFKTTDNFFDHLEKLKNKLISRLKDASVPIGHFENFYERHKARYYSKSFPDGLVVKIHNTFKTERNYDIGIFQTAARFYGIISNCNNEIDSIVQDLKKVRLNDNAPKQLACLKVNIDHKQFFDLFRQLRQLNVEGKPIIEILNAKEMGEFFAQFTVNSENEFVAATSVRTYVGNINDEVKKSITSDFDLNITVVPRK